MKKKIKRTDCRPHNAPPSSETFTAFIGKKNVNWKERDNKNKTQVRFK